MINKPAFNVPSVMVSSRILFKQAKTLTEKTIIARLLKEVCINKQDFEKAVHFRDIEQDPTKA